MEPLRGGNLAKTPPPGVQKIWQEADNQRTPVAWSLRFIWNHPEVIVVLSGMNKMPQVDENINIAGTALPNSLTAKELALIDRAAETFRSVMRVNCTGCQYCMPCPSGVNIPICFDTYNSYHAFKDWQARIFYLAMNSGILTKEPTFASQCIKCGKCMKKCPQKIQIPDMLEDVSRDMEGVLAKMATFGIKWFKKTKRKRKNI